VITRRTKLQLIAFVLLTVVGVSYVGAKYARLDRFFVDDSFTVVAHFPDSGGSFAGAEVSYRGVRIGQVEELELTDDGVDLHLAIDQDHDDIPADTLAVVGNRSAVGEQYVELQPQTDDGPFLREGDEIDEDDTRIPLSTTTLLTNLSNTVESVGEDDLRTVVSEFGTAFQGTGRDLGRIIDTSNAFIETANANFEMTTDLIKDGNTVLRGQLASGDSLRAFAREFKKFSGTLVLADRDLRTVIDNGSVTATELRTFLEYNQVDLSELLNNLVTTGEVVVENLAGVEQILAIYPYVVEGGVTVASKTPATGLYDAHFGMVLTSEPHVCKAGYEGTDTRSPNDGSNRPMNENARCTEPASQSNARGAQHAPPRAPAAYGADASPVLAAYDPETGELTWGDDMPAGVASPGAAAAPRTYGADSWRWLFLQPLGS
jgi:phospholipid/cholesterol/gamma-HCH transport system substrate-binding protein